jgi:ketosteroid isomerase-like protein
MTALQAVNEHYKEIIAKNHAGIMDKYVPNESTYVVLEGPRLTTKGYDKIFMGWDHFCKSGISLQSINWIEGPEQQEHETMAWVAGIINLTVSITKESEVTNFTNTFRSSFVLVKQNGNWKIQHEHVSVVHLDPYGIGDWLKK